MKKLLLLVVLCMSMLVGCTNGKEAPQAEPIAPVEVGPTDTSHTPVGEQSPNPVAPPVQGVNMEGAAGK